jgi:NADH-quinone oxidoreductase subunit L
VPGHPWLLFTVIGICLFIGAMGKSAQFPLHVWLPDSMEGPTPISALIHAATMVTAGIFMVARMSPLFELSQTARSVVLIVGAITTLFMALIALTQYDIKRVVAYSTLSQLGYMTAALGASAYSAAIFHLMTHAFFKALLFLGAGSVIIALHHEQDMRHMGGLRRRMPWTYWTFVVGAISSVGIPGFAGYYSKDSIIEAVHEAQLPGHLFAYLCVLLCVFVTATYTFRMLFLTFHGKEHFHSDHPPHESPAVVTLPLVLLAIPSVIAGYVAGSVLSGEYFGSSLIEKELEYPGLLAYTLHGFLGAPFWLGIAGIATAWFLYLKRPGTARRIALELGPLYALVERKYGFDELYAWLFAGGARNLGRSFWRAGDQTLIDGLMVNGSARVVGWFSGVIRLVQTGFVNQYAVAMLFGVLILTYWLWRH